MSDDATATMQTIHEAEWRAWHEQGTGKTGSLIGPQWQPRDLCGLMVDAGWTAADDLFLGVAICLSESQGYQRAYNLNKDADGNVLSKDCGLWQINIPATKIGTDEEARLFDDPAYNTERAKQLFDVRHWTPWYGYTLNVYTRDTYLRRAARGVGNYFAAFMLDLPTDILDPSGDPYEHSLTTPVLHYQHSVETLDGAASQAIVKLRELRALLTSTANQQRCDNIIVLLANARNEAKK